MSISVDYEEGDVTFTFDENGFTGQRIFICNWGDAEQLESEILGGSTDENATGELFPYREKALAYAKSAQTKGLGVKGIVGDIVVYEKAQITVTYKTGENNSQTLKPAVEFLTLSNTDLYWDSGQSKALEQGEAPGLMVFSLDWTYDIGETETFPLSVFSLIGSVNNSVVNPESLTNMSFGIGTLLYKGCDCKQRITATGKNVWSASYTFSYRPTGWNKFFKKGTVAPVVIYDKSGAIFKPYPEGDFSTLIVQRVVPNVG